MRRIFRFFRKPKPETYHDQIVREARRLRHANPDEWAQEMIRFDNHLRAQYDDFLKRNYGGQS